MSRRARTGRPWMTRSAASLALACALSTFAAGAQTIFEEDFEGGDVSAWSLFTPADTVNPSLVITAPFGVVADAQPDVEVAFADFLSGIDPSSLVITLDGTDLLPACSFSADGASCQPPAPLAEGDHLLSVSVTDRAGNAATDEVTFTFDPTGGDTVPPTIAITGPLVPVMLSAPEITIAWSDDDSGIDLSSFTLTILGADRTADCTIAVNGATCTPDLGEGIFSVEAAVSDRRGNGSFDTAFVEVDLDLEAPTITITEPTLPRLFNQPTPTLAATLADNASGIDVATVSVMIDTADITASCAITATSVACTAPSLGAGNHALRIDAADLAGNSGSARFDFEVVLDATPPSLSFVSPVDGSSLDDPTPAVILSLGDLEAGIDPSSLVVDADGIAAVCTLTEALDRANCALDPLGLGAHTITARVRDLAGSEAIESTTITIIPVDVTPPVLTYDHLVSGDVVSGTQATIALSMSDADSGIDPARFTFRVDDADVTGTCTVDSASATCTPVFDGEGRHFVIATVADQRGNRAVAQLDLVVDLTLPIAFSTPTSGDLINEATVLVTGTASPQTDTVEVNGTPATVAVDGGWTATLDVTEGANALTAVARNAGGALGTATVNVVRDTEAPRLVVMTPPDGFVTSAPQIVIAGEIGDASSSGRRAEAVTVTVGGRAAQVEQRSFLIDDFLLQPGLNRIPVTGTDDAGNTGTSELTVTFETDSAIKLEEMLGNAQEADVGTEVENPLIVRLTDALGRPLVDRTIEFEVIRGDGVVRNPPTEGRRVEVLTDEQGLAQARFRVGGRSGSGNHEVRATTPGSPAGVIFCSSARPGPPTRIARIAGSTSVTALIATADAEAPFPLLTQVFDAFGNPVAGADVTYRVITGGGNVMRDGAAPGEMATVQTDGEGKASIRFHLGPFAGVNVNAIEASVDGVALEPSLFLVSGIEAGPESQTTVSGMVFDMQDQPLAGATIRIDDAALSAISDAEGRFQINGVETGTIGLSVDGSTVTVPGNWPSLHFVLTVTSGEDNTVGKPIRLPDLDLGGAAVAGGDSDVIIALPDVPGAELTVFANSVTFPDGSTEGVVRFAQVASDRVPMEAPMGSNFMLAWTVQPTGAAFDPPARIAIPNADLPPGSTVDIFSFDHDLGEFVSVGTASVTDDGSQIVSNPGFGLIEAGWHGCVPPPAPPGDGCGPGNGGANACFLCIDDRASGLKRLEPQCDPECEKCEGDGCMPRTIDMATALADGDDERAVVGPETSVSFSVNTEGDCGELEYSWNFGDSSSGDNTSEEESPSHQYDEPGEYTVSVTVSCKGCSEGGMQTDEVMVSVVEVDLVLDGLPEEDESTPHEEDPGAFLASPDPDDMMATAERKTLQVSFEAHGADSGTLELRASSGASRVKVFTAASGGGEESLPKMWMVDGSDIDETFHVEGVDGSDSFQDITFTLEYNGDGANEDDEAKATAIGVEFDEPEDGDVHLFGEEIRWLAKAKPADVPGHMMTWEFSYLQGSGDPSMGSGEDGASGERRFDSTVESEDRVEVEVMLTVEGTMAKATREIEVTKPEVTAVSFIDDIPLKEWKMNDTGMNIDDPVWEKDPGGAVTKNQPAAYIRSGAAGGGDSMATVDLGIEAEKPLENATTIRVRGQGMLDFEFDEVDAKDWSFSPGDLRLESDPLKDTNDFYDDVEVTWEYIVEKQDGTYPPWTDAIELGQSNHTIYTTFAAPPPSVRIYDLSLEKVTKEYAPGESTIASIAQKVTVGMDNDLCYNPAQPISGNPLNAYTAGACLCWNNAILHGFLVGSVGIPSAVRLFWGGKSDSRLEFEWKPIPPVPGGSNFRGSAQFVNADHDLAPENAHFTYHAQSRVDGTYYDPSFGTTGRASVLHVCPGNPDASFQEGAQDASSSTGGLPPDSPCGRIDRHAGDTTAPGC